MTIPYRIRNFFKRAAVAALLVLTVAVLVWLLWLFWLDRFVIYTRTQGAVLDFNLPAQIQAGQAAQPPEIGETVSIYYNEGESQISTNTELTQMHGYYVELNTLRTNINSVRAQIQALPPNTPVMIDVKNINGNFFYSSSVSNWRTDTVDIAAMDELIRFLNASGMYTIARLPALRDYNYGLNHVPDGLPVSGGYLWMDDDNCYWLNPGSEGTMTYLVQIITELRDLGFDEVVLYDFYFPESSAIVFHGDKAETLRTAADTLVTICATDHFAVSFTGHTPDFPLPEGRTRLYLEKVNAADAANTAAQVNVPDTAVNLVFITENNDTRFSTYSVLRPLSSAH